METTRAQATVLFNRMCASGQAVRLRLRIESDPKMNKKSRVTGVSNGYLGRTVKVSIVEVTVGDDYSRIVNERLQGSGQEANFKAGKLPWGEHAAPPFISHKGNFYLQAIVEEWGDVTYLVDGEDGYPEEIEFSLEDKLPGPD